MNIVRSCLSLLVLAAVFTASAEQSGGGSALVTPSTWPPPPRCACRCCLRGDCYTVPAAGLHVASCDECTAAACRRYAAQVLPNATNRGTVSCLALVTIEDGACADKPAACSTRRLSRVAAECTDRRYTLQTFCVCLWLAMVALCVATATRKSFQHG